MERFKIVYPFTSENIKGYMNELDLKGKRIITITGSGDQALNAILRGCTDITCFDINGDANRYMKSKIEAIKELSYEEFISSMVFSNRYRDEYNLEFKYYNPNKKILFNNYLSKDRYDELKRLIPNVKISYIDSDFNNLKLKIHYDYMFLSNISDYLNLMFKDNILVNFKNRLLECFKNVDVIYMAYLYDYLGSEKRSDIDDIRKVKEVFKKIYLKEIDTALEGIDTKDAVMIIRKEDYYGE